MAKKSMKVKAAKTAKYSTREHNRCKICGRPHAYLVNTVFAVFVSESWHMRDRSPALRKQAGNQEQLQRRQKYANIRFNRRYAYKNS